MIRSRRTTDHALAVTISPPSGGARKGRDRAFDLGRIAQVDRRLTSTPSRRGRRLNYSKLTDPGGYGRVPEDCHSLDARRDLLEQFQPFPAQAVFERHKAGRVAARPRQTIDETGADRIATATNTIGTVWVSCINGATAEPPVANMTSGASATNSAAYLRMSSASPARPAVSIRTLRPSVQPILADACMNAAR